MKLRWVFDIIYIHLSKKLNEDKYIVIKIKETLSNDNSHDDNEWVSTSKLGPLSSNVPKIFRCIIIRIIDLSE